MHLALIISSLNSGGAERILTDLANYWVSKGDQVTLITLASPDAKPFYPLDSKVRLIPLNQTQNESSFLTRLGRVNTIDHFHNKGDMNKSCQHKIQFFKA